MPKCRENYKLRLRRRRKSEARLLRLSDKRMVQMPWADCLRVMLKDMGGPSFKNLVDEFKANNVLAYFLKRENVEITLSEEATPYLASECVVYDYQEGDTPDEIVKRVWQVRHKATLRTAMKIEGGFWLEVDDKAGEVLRDWKLLIRHKGFLVETLTGVDKDGHVEGLIESWFGFRKLTKAEIDKRDAEAGRVP